MKKLCALIASLFAVLLLLTPAGAWAAGDMPAIFDAADLLSQEELLDVNDTLTAVGKKHDAKILVVTVDSTQGTKAGDFANRALDKLKDPDAKNGSLLFLMAMDTRDWYIATDNTMKERITSEAGVDALSEAFLPKLKEGKYADAFKAYAGKADELLAYYEKEGEPYDPSAGFNPMACGIGLIIALGIGFLVRKHLISKMSNVAPKGMAGEYLVEDSINLRPHQDVFLYRNVTRTKKAKPAKTSSADSNHGGGGGKF